MNNGVEQFSDYGVRKWDSMTCKINGVYIEGMIKTLTENGITILPTEVNFSTVRFNDDREEIVINKEDFDKVQLEIFTYHRGGDNDSIDCSPYPEEWRRSWF